MAVGLISSSPTSGSQTLSLECPPASMMYNGTEADAFAIDITLMVAEQQILAPLPPVEQKKKERKRLMLAELLKEQDKSK